MRTDVISFILGSENRKKIVRTLLEYGERQWSCSFMEELSKVSHATVFRTLDGLKEFGILKGIKINKKDIIYELVDSPLVEEIERILNIEKSIIKRIVEDFVKEIRLKEVYSIILYGSSVKGEMKPGSDIDILVVLDKENEEIEKELFDKAAERSSELNKTLSLVIMGKKEVRKEKESQFIKSVKENMELLYGKEPF